MPVFCVTITEKHQFVAKTVVVTEKMPDFSVTMLEQAALRPVACIRTGWRQQVIFI